MVALIALCIAGASGQGFLAATTNTTTAAAFLRMSTDFLEEENPDVSNISATRKGCDKKPATGTLGNRSLLVVRLCIEDGGQFFCPGLSEDRLREVFWTGPKNVDRIFDASSYGRIRFPECLGHLVTLVLHNWKFGCADIGRLQRAARDAYNKAYPSLPSGSFHHTGYYVPDPPCTDLEFTWSRAFVISHAVTDGVAAHEVAHQHQLGLSHDFGDADDNNGARDDEDTDGQDLTNPMGYGFGSFGAHHRVKLGLIPDSSQKLINERVSQRIVIRALDIDPTSTNVPGITLLRIPRSDTGDPLLRLGGEYSVSYHSGRGYDRDRIHKSFHNKLHVYHHRHSNYAGDSFLVAWFDNSTKCKHKHYRVQCSGHAGWQGHGRDGTFTLRVVREHPDYVVLDVFGTGVTPPPTPPPPPPPTGEVHIRDAGQPGCLKASGGRKLLQKGIMGECATFVVPTVRGSVWKSSDVKGQCLDYFANRGWGLWTCRWSYNQRLIRQGSKWCVNGQHCIELAAFSTTSTTSTTLPPSSTVHTTSGMTLTVTTTSTPTAQCMESGDTVFLRTRSGNGNYVDVDGTSIRARWPSQGNLQAMTIEKAGGGKVHSGDVIYFRTHTGAHIDVVTSNVSARYSDTGAWQAIKVIKRVGSGPILPNDVVCLLSVHTSKHIDAEGEVIRARWNDCGDWQAMKIEREISGAIASGDRIHLLGHTGKRVDADPNGSVNARWSDTALWQTFTMYNYGGRNVFHGDAVFLKAHTGRLVHVEGTQVAAKWQEWGDWQRFIIHKRGAGPIMPGDIIFLYAHNGKVVDVSGTEVQARWADEGLWQSLTIEKAASQPGSRRLEAVPQRDAVVNVLI